MKKNGNEGIEDILIGESYNSSKKKGGKVVIVFFVLLLLILVGMIGAYYYFINQPISDKYEFLSSVANTNIKNFFSSSMYENLYDSISDKNYQTESNVSFTTTIENEKLEDIDVSKFDINIKNSNDVESKKSLNELYLNYSGNELFNIKLMSDEDNVSFDSDQITENYTTLSYDKLNEILGLNLDIKILKDIFNAKNVSFSDDVERNNYIDKYYTSFFEKIDDTKFSKQDNIVIVKSKENINVTAYTLKLTQEELNDTLVSVLEEIKDDEELLAKLCVDSDDDNENATPNVTITPIINTDETDESEENEEIEENDEENVENETEDVDEETSNVVSATERELNSNINISDDEEELEDEVLEEDVDIENSETDLEDEEDNYGISLINDDILIEEASEENRFDLSEIKFLNLIFGKKMNMSIKEMQDEISSLISDINKLEGNGLEVVSYVSENKTEKIAITLPNGHKLDIELLDSEENDNNITITYVDSEDDNKSNGFSLDLNKTDKDASISIKATYNIIENSEINKKIKLDLSTSKSSAKKYDTDCVITISTNEGETKVVIDNTITTDATVQIENLPEDTINLNDLSEEEFNAQIEEIKTKFENLYETEKNNLKFIDTNTKVNNQITSSKENKTVTIDDARNALITKVSVMMGEAIEAGNEFTIKDLKDLEIDGYEVTSTISSDKAEITVDDYKFSIDSNFTLTDEE